MVVGIQSFRKHAVLDADVYCRQFFVYPFTIVVDVAIHRHHLIQSPTARYMIHHDVTYRVATKGIIPTGNIGSTAAEPHEAHHYVVGIYPNRFACYTNTIARGALALDAYIRGTYADRGF